MTEYTVQPGDTLGKIAAKTLGAAGRYMEIAKANGMDDPNQIRVGQVLKIPGDSAEEKVEAPAAPAGSPAPVADTSSGAQHISESQLQQMMPQASAENVAKYTPALNHQMSKYEINSPLRISHFIAQLAHESGSFRYSAENLNYRASALRAVFGKYFPDDELAEAYARQPEKIANRVYANRMGNGDEASGDGWKYRGRGLIQLTGKDNYTNCGKGIGLDLVGNPEQLATDAEAAVAASGWFWNMRGLNAHADNDDILTITKRINGGTNGLDDRKKYNEKAKEVLGVS